MASARASAFVMVSNGLGAGRYIGGTESQEFAYTNSAGDYFYGARLEVRPLAEGLVLGTHGSLNRHDDMALDPRGPVVDLDRRAWSWDADVSLPWRQHVYGFYGAGELDDEWSGVRYQFDYRGWSLSTLWQPLAAPLELGVRYDEQTSGYRQVDDETVEQHWTFGANWRPRPELRLQANYVAKETVSPLGPRRRRRHLLPQRAVRFRRAAGRLTRGGLAAVREVEDGHPGSVGELVVAVVVLGHQLVVDRDRDQDVGVAHRVEQVLHGHARRASRCGRGH